MSYGDPNNPYGPPQGQQPGYPQAPQGQPGYGYPQNPPPGQQPGYGYPQQPAYPGYPGGNQMPMTMPGLMTTARVLIYIISGLQILVAIIAGIAVAAAQDVSNEVGVGDETDGLAGLGFALVAVLIALAVLGIILAVKFSTGGSGVRITTIVYASLIILGGIGNLVSGTSTGVFSAIIGLAIGGIILASMVNAQGAAWFNRPRY
ncbi:MULTISPECIES: hypothetical protein [unclassified Streptomyces]|uniref:hypothetical protein n=1 Tax=unclassified Streptomyces TaxID=2593676 RepID=UPI0033271429